MAKKPKGEKDLDLKKLGEKLRKLRLEKYPTAYDLTKDSKVPPQTIELTEEGLRHIRIDLLAKWLTACGTTFAEFFSDFDNTTKRPAGHDAHYRLLGELIKTESEFYIDGIYANLRGMLIAAQIENKNKPAVTEATTEEEGNLEPLPRKKVSGKRR